MNEDADALLKYAREELRQLSEEGCDTWELERRVSLIEGEPQEADKLRKARSVVETLGSLSPSEDFPYQEPSELEAIRRLRPDGPRHLAVALDDDLLEEKTLGAWLGRAAGCMLGKPVEGWDRARIEDLMEVCGLEQLDDYLPQPPENNRGIEFPDHSRSCLRGNIAGGVRDDDMDYTIIGLRLLEEHGREFTPRQVADFWLKHLPYLLTYTAERAAYRNLVNGIRPPRSGLHRNPCREWIGAQIRADAFGYACPGGPEQAAGLAFKDASVSHRKNGIYGEMWVAAMLAAAFVTNRAEKILRIGLSEIPRNCRLAEAIREVLGWHEEEIDAEECVDRIIAEFGHYHGVHTINNAAVVAMGLLWGDGHFSRSIGLAVRAGWDTDCNGATVGSVAGAVLGADRIPDHWAEPLNDSLETIVAGERDLTISGLAARTRGVQEAP